MPITPTTPAGIFDRGGECVTGILANHIKRLAKALRTEYKIFL